MTVVGQTYQDICCLVQVRILGYTHTGNRWVRLYTSHQDIDPLAFDTHQLRNKPYICQVSRHKQQKKNRKGMQKLARYLKRKSITDFPEAQCLNVRRESEQTRKTLRTEVSNVEIERKKSLLVNHKRNNTDKLSLRVACGAQACYSEFWLCFAILHEEPFSD